jgi:hypothetical protein
MRARPVLHRPSLLGRFGFPAPASKLPRIRGQGTNLTQKCLSRGLKASGEVYGKPSASLGESEESRIYGDTSRWDERSCRLIPNRRVVGRHELWVFASGFKNPKRFGFSGDTCGDISANEPSRVCLAMHPKGSELSGAIGSCPSFRHRMILLA